MPLSDNVAASTLAHDGGEHPVTVVVRRRVKAGKEQEYEAWLGALTKGAHALPGYLGSTIYRPGANEPRDFVSVFRFDSLRNLEAFESSDLRRNALATVGPLVEADAVWERMTGLEFWFTPPPGAVVAQPSRLRMAILLIVVVYLLVLSIGAVIGAVFSDWPFPARLLLTLVIEVFALTYLIMPRLTRALSKWIYPQTKAIR